jgi:hypothetical protein
MTYKKAGAESRIFSFRPFLFKLSLLDVSKLLLVSCVFSKDSLQLAAQKKDCRSDNIETAKYAIISVEKKVLLYCAYCEVRFSLSSFLPF